MATVGRFGLKIFFALTFDETKISNQFQAIDSNRLISIFKIDQKEIEFFLTIFFPQRLQSTFNNNDHFLYTKRAIQQQKNTRQFDIA